MATVNWISGTDGDWSNVAEWSTGRLPGTVDSVVLAGVDSITHSTGSDLIARLTTSGDALTISGGVLAVSAGANFGGSLALTGGTLSLSGTSTAQGGVSLNSGADLRLAAKARLTISTAFSIGATTVPSSAGTIEGAGTLTTTATTSLASNYRVLSIGGGVAWINSGTITDGMKIAVGTTLGATASFSNTATGVFNLTSDDAGIVGAVVLSNGVYGTGSASFGNAGLLEKTGGTVASTFAAFLVNVGRIAVTTGTLSLTGGGRLGGTITGGGVLALTSGTFSLSAPRLLSGTVLSLAGGALALARNQTIANVSVLSGTIDGLGTLSTNGTTTLTAGSYYQSILTIGGGANLVNHGSLVLSTGLITMGDQSGWTGTLTNLAGAVLDIAGDILVINGSTYGASGYVVATSSLSNAGLLEKTGGTGTTSIASFLTSTGTVLVSSGVLVLGGGGSLGGTLSGGGTIVLSAGTFALQGPRILGGTALILSGATISIAGGSTLSGLVFTGGTIDGPGTLANGLVTTLAAAPSGSYSPTVLTLGGGMHLTNSGTLIVSTGAIAIGDRSGLTASLINAAAGNVNFTGDAGISNGYFYDTAYHFGSSTFANAGLLEKTGGSGTSTIASVLTNTGTIKITSGALDLIGGGTLGGVVTGGTLLLGGGLFVLRPPSLTAGGAIVLAGGTVAVAYRTTLSHLAITGGEIDGPGTFTNALSVTLIGSGTGAPVLTLGGGLTFNNTGSLFLSSGGIAGGDATGPTATLINAAGAVFDFTGNAGISNGVDYGTGAATYGNITMTNAGLLEKTAGTGISTIVAVLSSTGTIKVVTGAIDLLGGGTLGGTISGGGTLLLGGGGFTLAAPKIIGGTSVLLAGGTLAIQDGATLSTIGLLSGEIDGPGTFLTSGRTNAGSVTLAADAVWRNTGSVSLSGLSFGGLAGGSGTLVNTATGSLRIASLNGGSGAAVTNAGSLDITIGDPLAIYAGVFTSSGTVGIDNGSLDLAGGGVLSGLLAGPGQLVLSQGTFALAGLTTQAGSNIVIAGGTVSLAAAATATVSGSLWEQSGALLLAAGSTLSLLGDAAFGVDFSQTAHVDGQGTVLTSGQVSIADTDYTDGTALRLGGGVTWTNSGFVYDAGFIRVGDGHGVRAAFVNTADGAFEITTDDGGIGNNAVLTPAGVTLIGGAGFANAGLLAKTGGTGQSFVAATITNTGIIDAASGTLDLLIPIAGTGTLQIEAGATLETVGFSAGQTLVFDGAGATLLLDARQSVTTPITGFAVGDAIDLSFAASATAAITGSTLTITPSGQAALSFVSATSLAGDTVSVTDDGQGGTLVTLTAPHTASLAALNGRSFADFVHGASVEVTDLRPVGLVLGWANGRLSLDNGGHHAVLGLPGVAGLSDIAWRSDGHGGTLLSYHPVG